MAAIAATIAASDRRASRVRPEHRISTLDGGVRVVTEHMPSVRSVALGYWIGTGSAGEQPDEAGISHLLEHMLFRGTERFGSEEIDQIFDAMGAEINAGTDKEATSLYTRVLDRHLGRAFEVMSDMIWEPRFGELEAEREVVLEEIAMYEDDPQDRVFDGIARVVFGDHPLGRPVIGRPSGWPPKTASPSTSKTVSCGSSSYIAISSSTTSRSGSMSWKAGRQTMSAITSKAVGRCWSSIRA